MILGVDTVNADGDEAYVDLAMRKDNVRLYSAFVNYYDEVDELVHTDELPIGGCTPRHAREVAQAAVARDWQPGGEVVYVEVVANGSG